MNRRYRLFAAGLTAGLATLLGGCIQAPIATDPAATPSSAVPTAAAQVGDATRDLVALQRGGTAASPNERGIAGDVASRSYQRYLKSFDQPIPDRFGPTVNGGGSGSSAASR
jgi:hypothetical protein